MLYSTIRIFLKFKLKNMPKYFSMSFISIFWTNIWNDRYKYLQIDVSFSHRYWDGMHGYLQRDTLDTQVTKMGNYRWQGAWQNGGRPVRTPVEISIKWTVKCLVHGYPRCMLICHYLPCLGLTTHIDLSNSLVDIRRRPLNYR